MDVDNIPIQISLFDLLETFENNAQEIQIKGAINPKVSLKEIDVRLSYGDLVLIVSMLRDYVKGLDDIKGDDLQWQAYYRNKFMSMADKISSQLGYDYDAALAKCIKKQKKESDIGEDALILSLKRSQKKVEPNEDDKSQDATERKD